MSLLWGGVIGAVSLVRMLRLRLGAKAMIGLGAKLAAHARQKRPVADTASFSHLTLESTPNWCTV